MCVSPSSLLQIEIFIVVTLVHLSLWYTECVEINDRFFCSPPDYEKFLEDLKERIAHHLKTLDFKSNQVNG